VNALEAVKASGKEERLESILQEFLKDPEDRNSLRDVLAEHDPSTREFTFGFLNFLKRRSVGSGRFYGVLRGLLDEVGGSPKRKARRVQRPVLSPQAKAEAALAPILISDATHKLVNRVQELAGDGQITKHQAFEIVAKELGRTPSSVGVTYYRVASKAGILKPRAKTDGRKRSVECDCGSFHYRKGEEEGNPVWECLGCGKKTSRRLRMSSKEKQELVAKGLYRPKRKPKKRRRSVVIEEAFLYVGSDPDAGYRTIGEVVDELSGELTKAAVEFTLEQLEKAPYLVVDRKNGRVRIRRNTLYYEKFDSEADIPQGTPVYVKR